MSGSTVELNLKTAVDADDTADYLTLSLADSLRTVDALFNNVSGHSHSGAHQGGPLGAGSITGDMIADGSITSDQIAVGAVISAWAVTASTANPQTTSTTLVDMPDMTADISTTAGSTLFIWGITSMNSSNTGGLMQLAVSFDGTVISPSPIQASAAAVGYAFPLATHAQVQTVTVGAHQIRLRWNTSASNTITALGTQRSLLIVEYKR